MMQILDTAIGLAFVYLLFSMLLTALNELILAKWDKRAAFLKEGLIQLLGNHQCRDAGNPGRILVVSQQ